MNVVELLKRAQTVRPLPFIEFEHLLAEDIDDQLTARGPDGDGAISAVGAEAEGIGFVEEPELAAALQDDEPTVRTWTMSGDQEDGDYVSSSFSMSAASEDCDGFGLPDCG